jgi:WD40 repeat protein
MFSVPVGSDGRLIASGGDREIRLWDMLTGDQLATMQVSMWVSSLAFTLDGKKLVWGGGDGSVHFKRATDELAN